MNPEEIDILVVDDEPDILEFIKYSLEREGFRVSTAKDGYDAIKMVKETVPHLILLDIMMPDMDGVSTCFKLRANKDLDQTLIAFLTARTEEYSEIAGLEAGADDYIRKPINPRILVSRINALLRRHKTLNQKEDQTVQLSDLYLNKDKYEVSMKGDLIELAKKEFDILWYIASKPGKVFSREEIYRKVWGNDVIVGNRTIDVHISKLRAKLKHQFIKTIKGIGYKIDG